MEDFDAEVESLESGNKRKNKPPPKLQHYRESLDRHRAHVLRLETMLRLLDNDQLAIDETLLETKDMLEDYLDRNQVWLLGMLCRPCWGGAGGG